MKWYKQRDEDKIKTDIAKNDFEAMIYKLKDFLSEDENHKYVDEAARLIYIEQLVEMEDWLYDEGADMNYTVYDNKAKNLTNDYNKYNRFKTEHSHREEILDKTEKAMVAYESKIEDLKVNKTWISEEEFKDVTDKITDLREWVKNKTEEQNSVSLTEEPVLKAEDIVKKMKTLKKLYTKVASKKRPKPKKEEKKEEEKEDFNDGDETESNKTESEQPNNENKSEEQPKDEEKKEEEKKEEL